MSNILAGIGRGQLEVLEERVKQRRDVFKFYFNNLGKTWLNLGQTREARGEKQEVGSENASERGTFNIRHSSPTGIYFLKEPEGYFSNRWLTTIIVDPEETNGVTREDIRQSLARENIEARPLWKPMHLQPVYKKASFYGNGISNWLFKYGLCLPSGSNLTKRNYI